MISNLEEAGEFVLRGWACNKSARPNTISLDVFINGEFVARLPASTYRSDLKAAGYGDGYHAFYFNPFDFLSLSRNMVEVRESSSSKQIYGGFRIVSTDLATNRASFRTAAVRAQARWKNPVAAQNAQGEKEFLRHLLRAAHFNPALRILEIGSGQGELLDRILKRKRPFGSYLGLDLSRANVDALHNRFANSKISFLHGDAARYPFNSHFDLVIASSICDTLFPSFLPLLKNVTRVLPAGRLFAFDLSVEDDRASISRAEWKGDNFSRLYSQAEVRRQLGLVGMEMLSAEIYENTAGEHRVFITSVKLPTQPSNRFAF